LHSASVVDCANAEKFNVQLKRHPHRSVFRASLVFVDNLWIHIDRSLLQTMNLAELYRVHQGKVSDKWSSYLDLYEQTIASLRIPVRNLFEIGVQNGGSLEIWAKYLPSAERIVGCDIDERCHALKYDDPRIHVVVADATKPSTRDRVISIVKQFDVVIEDGSHVPSDVVNAFIQYWPHVRPGGVFIAEDLHCDYFPGHRGSVKRNDIANRFFAQLIHIINHEHWAEAMPPGDLFASFPMVSAATATSWIDTIASVSFHNSVAIVRKAATIADTQLGDRNVCGQIALVDPAALGAKSLGSKSLLPLHEKPVTPSPSAAPSSFSQLFNK
jgi:predicted O-methyltransferase YrrM